MLNVGFASNHSSLLGMYNFIQKLQASKNKNKYRITSKWVKSPWGNGEQNSSSIKMFLPF